MNALRVAGLRLSALFRGAEVDQELDDELRFHLTMRAQEHARGGMPPAEASRHARRQFGNFNSIKDACRDFSGAGPLERLLDDVRFAWRMLSKDRSFTIIAVLTLALAIAGNTTVFTIANSVLFRSLPFPNAHELVAIRSHSSRDPGAGRTVSLPDFQDFRQQASWFAGLGVFYTQRFIASQEGGGVTKVHGAFVSSGVFPLLGIEPLLGRAFSPAEDEPGNRRAIISYEFWKQSFGGANVIGASVKLDGEDYRIVGVMPRHFRFPITNEPMQVWTTLAAYHETAVNGAPPLAFSRDSHYFEAIGRLAPGSTVAQADSGLKEIAGRVAALHPATNRHFDSCTVGPWRAHLTDRVRPELLTLSAAALCLLGVACANIGTLLLARSTTRARESAIRAALGASRGRIVRQLLIEGLLLGSIASILGLAISLGAAPFLVSLLPSDFPRAYSVGVDGMVLAFAAGIAVLVASVFAAAPAWASARAPLAPLLNECSRGTDAKIGGQAFRNGLVAVELVLAFVLLAGAAFFLRGLQRLREADPGFETRGVVTATVWRQENQSSEPTQTAEFFQQLTRRVAALPGVQSSSAVSHLPFRTRRRMTELVGVESRLAGLPLTKLCVITPGYFATLKIPFVSGRDFDERDLRAGRGVVIVNESLARALFGKANPLGQRLQPKLSDDNRGFIEREIIGVVQDVQSHRESSKHTPELYVLHEQFSIPDMSLVARTGDPAATMLERMRDVVAALDRDTLFHEPGSIAQYIDASIAQPRLNSAVLAGFAIVGVSLAAIGLFGVVAYSVAQRRHEIGIRLALGAKKSAICRLIVEEGARLIGWSLVAGVVCSLAVRPFLPSFGHSSAAEDASLLLAVALFVAALALVACWLPARRAANLDPLRALGQR